MKIETIDLKNTVVRVRVPFGQWDISETYDGNLRIDVVGAGTLKIIPTGHISAIVLEPPQNRRASRKTIEQEFEDENRARAAKKESEEHGRG